MLKQDIQQLTLYISTGIIRIFPTLDNDTNDIVVRYDNDDLELVFELDATHYPCLSKLLKLKYYSYALLYASSCAAVQRQDKLRDL